MGIFENIFEVHIKYEIMKYNISGLRENFKNREINLL